MDDARTPDEPAPIWPDAPRRVPDAPFPAYRFVPGRHPHPRRDPRGSLHGAPEPLPGLPADAWARDTSYLQGVDLYHAGYLWEAHEVWEAVYFAADAPRHRALVQALIQLAAAELNAHLGKTPGVRFLAGRVLARLDEALPRGGARLAGLDVGALRDAVARRFAPVLDDASATPARLVAGPPVRLELPS